ncbi:MAG: RloB domain-containing protein, partial [Taibaiella sp.]|nr:RloB domain-containing protein [Taibaiella sp.]
MLIRNFSYTRREPNRDAVVFYIFCEGKWTEPQYFNFFASRDSRIRLEIIAAEQHDNNSPDGLFEKAKNFISKSPNNPNPKYDLNAIDQVWFVIDTDDWQDKIPKLKKSCSEYENWFVAQSNPSFEIWLYYHFH